MSETIKAALAANGLRAELRGRRVAILPVTAQVLDEVGAEALAEAAGRRVRPGDLVAFWSPDGAAGGEAIGPEDGGDLEFLAELADGSEMRFPARSLSRACADLLYAWSGDMARRMEGNAARPGAADAPERAAEGEAPDAPAFAEGALRGVPALVECVEQGARAVLDSPAAAPPERSRALAAQHAIDMARLGDASAEHGVESGGHGAAPQGQGGAAGRIAQAPVWDPAAELSGGVGTARATDSVIADPEGFNEMQERAQDPNAPLTGEVFGALTSTAPSDVHVTRLSDTDHERGLRRLEASEEAAWAEPARSRVAGILADRMPDYRFETRFFEHEGADVMLVRDHAGAYLYAWDSATRAVQSGPRTAAAPPTGAQARRDVRSPDPDPDESPCPA